MEKATEKQIKFMRNLKIPEETIQLLSIAGAKDLISAKLAEREAYNTPAKQKQYDEDSKEHAEKFGYTVFDGSPIPTDAIIKPQDLGKQFKATMAMPQVVKEQIREQFNPTSMYVSYAKDIFISLPDTIPEIKRMELAIGLVKQAHEAFS